MEYQIRDGVTQIVRQRLDKLEKENATLRKQLEEAQRVVLTVNGKSGDVNYSGGSENGTFGFSKKANCESSKQLGQLEDSDTEKLLKVVELWDKSRYSMVSSLEKLLDGADYDSIKIDKIRQYLSEKKKTISEDPSFEKLIEGISSVEHKINRGLDVKLVKGLVLSLFHNLNINAELANESRLSNHIASKNEIAQGIYLSDHEINKHGTLPKGLRVRINSFTDMNHCQKQSTQDPLLVWKSGSYWHSTDEYTYTMVTKMLRKTLTSDELMQFLRTQILGRYNLIKTSFGHRLRLYADYTASGQELLIFNNLLESIAENYANTHAEASYDGKFMNKLFREAELKILKSCNADPLCHSVLPMGTGATGAIEFIQKIIGTYIPPKTARVIGNIIQDEELKANLREKGELPLVLVTSYEYHSNNVTWRNQLCDVKTVPLLNDGYLDFEAFKDLLETSRGAYRTMICSFSAGSNVTGIKTDIERTIAIAKKYNALVFFDYAGAGPYVKIDMSLNIDGICLSPHKFLGGPGTCGIAIIKNSVYDVHLAPTHGGGGTVDFCNSKMTIFTRDIMARERSGTPAILQIVKTGLVLDLKSQIYKYLDKRQGQLTKRFLKRFGSDPRVYIIGPLEHDARIPLVSFNIYHQGPYGQRILHPMFVSQLLSDLFGIQGRGGCTYEGSIGHSLLNLEQQSNDVFMKWLVPLPEDKSGFKGIKLGWVRINLHFSLSDEELNYIMSAIDFIAESGYMFLPYYTFDPISGNWRNVSDEDIQAETLTWKLLQTPKLYAKDEAARSQLIAKQLDEAKKLACHLSEHFEVDWLPQWGDLAFFYVAKGNLKYPDQLYHRKESL